MNGESYRLRQSKTGVALRPAGSPTDTWTAPRSIPLRPSADAHRSVTLMLNTDRPVVRLCSAPWHKIAPPLTDALGQRAGRDWLTLVCGSTRISASSVESTKGVWLRASSNCRSVRAMHQA